MKTRNGTGFVGGIRRWLALAGWVWVAGWARAADGGGTSETTGCVVEGRVELAGRRTAPVPNQRYEIVSRGGVIALSPPLAVVFVDGEFPTPSPAPVVQMKQKDMTFLPALLPVQRGTKVEFPNLDRTYHNVFSYSPAKRFDLGRYLPEERPIPSQVFDVPGLVTIRCDIHEHMRALVLVLSTPHFVVTETDGRFRLSGIPAGRHVLKAWLNSKTTLELKVDAKAGAVVSAPFP